MLMDIWGYLIPVQLNNLTQHKEGLVAEMFNRNLRSFTVQHRTVKLQV